MNRGEAVQGLKAVYATLREDFTKAAEQEKVEEPTQYHLRMRVRAEFALLDGLLYQLRQITLATLRAEGGLEAEEVVLLREMQYRLGGNGQISSWERYESFLSLLPFTLRMYAKNHGTRFEPDLDDEGWEAMKEYVDIRDRIAHPKSSGALELSRHDLDQVYLASEWWQENLIALFRECGEADEFWKTQLQQET